MLTHTKKNIISAKNQVLMTYPSSQNELLRPSEREELVTLLKIKFSLSVCPFGEAASASFFLFSLLPFPPPSTTHEINFIPQRKLKKKKKIIRFHLKSIK